MSRSSSSRTRPTGLKAIVAIYSTALGPALGGTRFYPYAAEQDALRTCSTSPRGWRTRPRSPDSTWAAARPSSSATRRRSSARRCFAPTAGSWSPLRSVLHRRATSARSPRTWTTSPGSADYVTGRTVAHGGAGDSPCSRRGRLPGHARRRRGDLGLALLAGRTVGVAGVGKVGRHLVNHLVEDGASWSSRTCRAAVDRRGTAALRHAGEQHALTSRRRLDVYAPCALGGALSDDVVGTSPRRSSAARRTTSSRTRASGSRSRTAACSTRPTTSSTPAA